MPPGRVGNSLHSAAYPIAIHEVLDLVSCIGHLENSRTATITALGIRSLEIDQRLAANLKCKGQLI